MLVIQIFFFIHTIEGNYVYHYELFMMNSFEIMTKVGLFSKLSDSSLIRAYLYCLFVKGIALK